MNGTVEVTRDSLNTTVQDNDIVLLDFWAGWCGPCRSFAPVFEQAAQAHPDIVFGKVDTEAQRELAAAFSITSIPTLVAVRDQTVVFSQAGALPPAALDELIRQVRDLDVSALGSPPPEVGLEELEQAQSSGAVVLDVREPHEYVTGHVVGARLVPIATVPQAVAELPTDQPVYVICQSGHRSLDAAQFLVQNGVDARSVAGGTGAWIASGRPIETGTG